MKKRLRLLVGWVVMLSIPTGADAQTDDGVGPARDIAADAQTSSFWRQSESAENELPADQFYPRGRRFPFSGFAGVPQRDRMSGYNLLGPVYVKPDEFLADANDQRIAVIYPIGIHKDELAAAEQEPMTDAEIRSRIEQQVVAVCDDMSIAWWYLVPEELRYWREHEKNYLRVATAAIRQSDPIHRPIWIYEPNHRTADSLAITGEFVDIIGKGCYTNFAGQQNNRVWVRWSMQQQNDAIAALGGDRTSILVPEMFQDPQSAGRPRIANWVRHDVVLGLIHGAKGVVVYSLFKRPQVKQYYDQYYDAYSEMARELLQRRELGKIFLFGEHRNDLMLKQMSGPSTVSIARQDAKVESDSLTEQEQALAETLTYPAISSREYAYAAKRYLFICNSSSDESVKIEVTGFPEKTTLVTEAFTFNFLHPRVRGGVLSDVIPPLGVRCYVFSKYSPIGR